MFSQLQLPVWSTTFGAAAFFVTLLFFLAAVVSTLRWPKSKVERMENLPWEDDKRP